MPVEIREIVLQARVLSEEAPAPETRHAQADRSAEAQKRLRAEILRECEKMIRDRLDRRAAR